MRSWPRYLGSLVTVESGNVVSVEETLVVVVVNSGCCPLFKAVDVLPKNVPKNLNENLVKCGDCSLILCLSL